jgi:hypothetical protein
MLPQGPGPIRWGCGCVYEAATGARAHATFGSHEEAMRFAERHAESANGPGAWTQMGESWLLKGLAT